MLQATFWSHGNHAAERRNQSIPMITEAWWAAEFNKKLRQEFSLKRDLQACIFVFFCCCNFVHLFVFCRLSLLTPTTRRRTPWSLKPSIKTPMSCSSMLNIQTLADLLHLLNLVSRFANTSEPFACKDIKIALTEIMELTNSLDQAQEKVLIPSRFSFWD